MPEPDPQIDDELAQLLEAVANRDLTPTQHNQLADRLAADATARAAFIQATAFDAMLSYEFPAAESRVASSALQLTESETAPQTHNPFRFRAISRTKLLVVALASLAATIFLAIAFAPFKISPQPVATLASSENAAWESSLPTTPGSELVPGRLKLKAGLATIRFDSGAEVTLEAPAEFEIISAMRGKLVEGVALTDVPDEAIGFVIETPDAYAIDYGTRFAVQVDRTAGRSDFELIEGEIAVHHSGTAKEVRLTEPHKAVSVHEGSVNVIDLEQRANARETASDVIRIGTNGRSTSVLRNNKRHKFLDPAVLSVKKTDNGKWDHRSFFAFDLSTVDVSRLKAARLRLNLVPSQRGFASRLPVVNRFGIYGLTNPEKSNWVIDSNWEEAPAPEDGIFLGSFEIPRSQDHGTFGIANRKLVEFLQKFPGQSVTLILVRESTQVEGSVPGLTHMFASDAHPVAVGPMLELTIDEP